MSNEISYFKLHEDLTSLYPPMKSREYTNLVMNIKRYGQIDPVSVWVDENYCLETAVVIDGRHRQKACQDLGIECEYRFEKFDTFEGALQFVKSCNHIRRKDNTEVLNNKERRALIKSELLRDPDRSDRVISETTTSSASTVGSVRKEIGAHSDNRVAADGRVNTGNQGDMSNFENLDMSPVSTTSAPEEEKQAVSEGTEVVSEGTEVVSEGTGSASEADVLNGLYASSNQNTRKKYATWVRRNMNSPIGPFMASRYAGQDKGQNVTKFFNGDAIYLYIGWPDLGSDFIEGFAVKTTSSAKSAKMKELVARVDDLDKINAANKGMSDYQKTQNSRKLWNPVPVPQVVVPIGKRKEPDTSHLPKFTFHGEEIKWYEIRDSNDQGLTVVEAHCALQLVEGIYMQVFGQNGHVAMHEFRDVDLENFARTLRHLGDYVEGISSNNARRVFDLVAQAITNNPSKRQEAGEIPHKKHYTPQ